MRVVPAGSECISRKEKIRKLKTIATISIYTISIYQKLISLTRYLKSKENMKLELFGGSAEFLELFELI